MNTLTTSTRPNLPRGMLTTAILSALISTFAAVCNADAPDVPQAIVKYADLDISTSQGAATLYGRIRSATGDHLSPRTGACKIPAGAQDCAPQPGPQLIESPG